MKFIGFGGLPRACSTLMINFIGQNPKFKITPTSTVYDQCLGLASQWAANPDNRANINYDELTNTALYRGMYGYIQHWYDNPEVVFDKGRGWAHNFELLEKIANATGSKALAIAPIIDLRFLVASMERAWRNNPQSWQKHNEESMRTIDGRIKFFLTQPPVVQCLDGIRDSIARGNHKKILYVKAEEFCRNPIQELERIYQYVDETFTPEIHNKYDVVNIVPELDHVHGIYANHDIQPVIAERVENFNDVLSPERQKLIIESFMWYYKEFYPEVLATFPKQYPQVTSQNIRK